MKSMKIFIDGIATKLLELVEEKTKTQRGIVDLKDLFGRFSMDTIALCAFGIDGQSFSK